MAIDDQVLFEKHCKENLSDFKNKWIEASNAYNDTLEILKGKDMHHAKKHNLATREGNLVLVRALTEIGAQQWRPQKGDKVKTHTQRASGANVDSGVKNKKPLPKGIKGIKLDW